MPFAAVRDIRIYYELQGTGARLLSISGSGSDLRKSPTIFELPIAQHFQILAYDQRGLGQSSRPDIPYTMADYAEDANALLEAVGWDHCLVMGLSFGGMVAQELALRYPQRVERLVLGCTSSGGAGGASYPLHKISDLPAAEYIPLITELGDKRRDAIWRAENPAEYQTLYEQTLARMQIGAGEPGYQMGSRRLMEARSHHDTYERLPALRMPVYICGGRYDGTAPVANLEAMQKQIPGSQLEFFEGGHSFHTQDPRAFEHITAFLQGEADA